MTATLDDRLHAEAVKAAIAAVTGEGYVFDLDDVPSANGNDGSLPDIYITVALEQMPSTDPRMSGQTAVRQWLVTIEGVGRSVDESRWALVKAKEALYERSLMVDGRTTTPLVMDPGQAPDHEDGRYLGLLAFTYSH